jgi:hypothetical protein
MFPFRYAGIYVRGCGFSRDLGVKASVEPPAVACRLSKSRSVFPVVYADIGDKI